jgi:hypothetical protein
MAGDPRWRAVGDRLISDACERAKRRGWCKDCSITECKEYKKAQYRR